MVRALVYPRGLAPRGKHLWRSVLEIRPRLGPGERVLLEEACRMTDRLERLNEQIAGTYLPYEEVGERIVLVTDAAQQEARLTVIALRQVMMSLGIDRLSIPAPAPVQAPPPKKADGPKDPLDQITSARERKAAGGKAS